MNISTTSAFTPYYPPSVSHSPSSLGSYSDSTSASSSTTSTSVQETVLEFPDRNLYSFSDKTIHFDFEGSLRGEVIYRFRKDILCRLASKIIILLQSFKFDTKATYKSFYTAYLSILETLTDYPIFYFQKFNFSVTRFEVLPHKEQDRSRILRHLEILRELGGNPEVFRQVGRIRIKSGKILYCTNSCFHQVSYDKRDLPDLVL